MNNLENQDIKVEVKNEADTLLITLDKACAITGIGHYTMQKLVKINGFPALLLPR